MKQCIPWAVGITMLLITASSWPEKQEDNPLDRMLKGIRPGISFKDAIKAHPDAVYSDEERRSEPLAADKPGALLIAHASDPFLGMHAFANIGFRDGAAYELVAVWSGNSTEIRSRCRRFFKAALDLHGNKYVRKSMFVFPDSAEERAVAVFFWQDDKAATLTFYTPPPADKPDGAASLTYAQFKPDASFLDDVFVKKPVPTEKTEQAWQHIAGLVDSVEKELAPPDEP